MKRLSWLMAALILFTAAAWAVQQDVEPGKGADLAWLPTKQMMLLSVRVADVWNGELGKIVRAKLTAEVKQAIGEIEKEAGLPAEQIERFTLVARHFNSDALTFIRATKGLDKDKLLKRIVPGGEAKTVGDFTYLATERTACLMLSEREYVIGVPRDIEWLINNRKEKTDKGLAPALALMAKGHSLVVGVNTDEMRKFDDDLPPDIDPYWPLLKSQYATLSADVGTKTTGQLRIVFERAADARNAEEALEKAREAGMSAFDTLSKPFQKDDSESGKALVALIGQARGALKAGKVARAGNELTASVEAKFATAQVALAASVAGQRIRDAALRSMSVNKLKQLGLALHNHHQVYNSLPANAVFDTNGKALLSWRVLILPFIEEGELYKEFKFNEPWDSKHNKALLAKMPRVFARPDGKGKPGMTGLVSLMGTSAVFEGKTGLRYANFTDGLSNTLFIIETDKQIPWTKPEDVEFDPAKDPPALSGIHEGGYYAIFGGGEVRFLKKDIKKDILKAMITRNGGETIEFD